LTSCVPDGTLAPVGFYPTEALSLTGQETNNDTQKRAKPIKRRRHSNPETGEAHQTPQALKPRNGRSPLKRRRHSNLETGEAHSNAAGIQTAQPQKRL